MGSSVLVIDDDEAFRGLATRVLAAWGFDVIGEAATCATALIAARALRPDAALVDVNLPDGDGLALAHVLAALPLPPRIVLISGDADAAGPAALARCGAAGFVAKEELASGLLAGLLAGDP